MSGVRRAFSSLVLTGLAVLLAGPAAAQVNGVLDVNELRLQGTNLSKTFRIRKTPWLPSLGIN